MLEIALKLYPLSICLGILLLVLAETYGRSAGAKHFWPTPWHSTVGGFLMFCGAIVLFTYPWIWYSYFYELEP